MRKSQNSSFFSHMAEWKTEQIDCFEDINPARFQVNTSDVSYDMIWNYSFPLAKPGLI